MNNNGLFMISPEGELYLRDVNLEDYKETLKKSSSNIRSLDLRNNFLRSIPHFICDFSSLLTLDLRENKLETLPESLKNLVSLTTLKLDNNTFNFFPLEIYSLQNLTTLTISHNSILIVDKRIKKLKSLKALDLSYNKLKNIPHEIGKLKSLNMLYLQSNEFISLPAVLHKLVNLQQFGLEWLRYTYPSLPILLKGANGEILIKSLQNLSNVYDSTESKEISLLSFLKNFTESHFSLDKSPQKGVFLLHKAVLNNDIGVVKGLIFSGCDIDMLDSDGYSALVLSIRENNFEISAVLLSAGCNTNIGGGIYGSALHIVISKNDLNLLQILLKSKTKLDLRNSEGNTVLHILMIHFQKNNNKSAVIGDFLINAGADPNAYNNDMWAPIHIAARKPQNAAIKWVLSVNSSKMHKHCKFDLNLPGGKQDWSALHLAAHAGLFKTSKLLFKHGADIYFRNKLGKTPKDISKGNLSLYKFLAKLEKEYLKKMVTQEPILGKNNQTCEEIQENEGNQIRKDMLYEELWMKFKKKDVEGMKEFVENFGNSENDRILIVDSVFLIGKFVEKQPKSYLKSIAKQQHENNLVIREAILALKDIKAFESKIISPRNIIGPRVSITSQVRKIKRNDSEVPDDI